MPRPRLVWDHTETILTPICLIPDQSETGPRPTPVPFQTKTSPRPVSDQSQTSPRPVTEQSQTRHRTVPDSLRPVWNHSHTSLRPGPSKCPGTRTSLGPTNTLWLDTCYLLSSPVAQHRYVGLQGTVLYLEDWQTDRRLHSFLSFTPVQQKVR